MNATGFYDVAELVKDCVCAQIDDLADQEGVPDGYGCPCRAFVSAGVPEIECCDDSCEGFGGQLSVHLENVYPSDTFPSAAEQFEPCKAASWVGILVVTLTRCGPHFASEQGGPADPERLTEIALVQAIDSYAVLTALGCCVVADAPPRKSKRRVFIQGTTPIASDGGCVGIEVRAAVELGQVCSCAPTS